MTENTCAVCRYRQEDREREPEREDRLATVGLVVLDEVRRLLSFSHFSRKHRFEGAGVEGAART